LPERWTLSPLRSPFLAAGPGNPVWFGGEVAWARLYYWTDTVPVVDSTLGNTIENSYVATIPAYHVMGDTLYYYIDAADSFGNRNPSGVDPGAADTPHVYHIYKKTAILADSEVIVAYYIPELGEVFVPSAVAAGDFLGRVQETKLIEHRVMVPPGTGFLDCLLKQKLTILSIVLFRDRGLGFRD